MKQNFSSGLRVGDSWIAIETSKGGWEECKCEGEERLNLTSDYRFLQKRGLTVALDLKLSCANSESNLEIFFMQVDFLIVESSLPVGNKSRSKVHRCGMFQIITSLHRRRIEGREYFGTAIITDPRLLKNR
ncbi:hypothetical protein Tco_1501263 [Tanacetum coccineum]